MYGDTMASVAIEKLTERYFYPHPYAYPIIGSAENLKNPRLSEMRRFFEKYYVASNMGLILSGDFDTEEVLPILESTFHGYEREAASPGYCYITAIQGTGEGERTYSYAFRENYGIGIPGSSRESSGSSCAQYRRIFIE